MSALSKRLDRLEDLLAVKLQGPTVIIWIPEGKTVDEVLAEGIADGSIPPNARPQGLQGWRERRGEARPPPIKVVRWLNEEEARLLPDWEEPTPQPTKEPLALPAPLKRLAFEQGSDQKLETQAIPPSDDDCPYRRRRAVVLPKSRDKFNGRIPYPKTGNI
jgi:hypothetical protein